MQKVILKDSDLNMIWKDPQTGEAISVHPDFYQDNGTPINDEGEDYIYSHTEIEEPDVTIVSVIEHNAIKHIFMFHNNEQAESKFVSLVEEFEQQKQDQESLEDALDDGYWECDSCPITICISHPE